MMLPGPFERSEILMGTEIVDKLGDITPISMRVDRLHQLLESIKPQFTVHETGSISGDVSTPGATRISSWLCYQKIEFELSVWVSLQLLSFDNIHASPNFTGRRHEWNERYEAFTLRDAHGSLLARSGAQQFVCFFRRVHHDWGLISVQNPAWWDVVLSNQPGILGPEHLGLSY